MRVCSRRGSPIARTSATKEIPTAARASQGALPRVDNLLAHQGVGALGLLAREVVASIPEHRGSSVPFSVLSWIHLLYSVVENSPKVPSDGGIAG